MTYTRTRKIERIKRMTYEEAIKTIKTAIAEVEWEYPMEYAVAFEMAIKALKKQIPMNPYCHGKEYECPNPECRVDIYSYHPEYCDVCGQAIDWGDN